MAKTTVGGLTKKVRRTGLSTAGPTRLELATSALTGQRSNQLSYNPNFSDIYDYHLNFYGCQEFRKNKVVMLSARKVAST